MKCYCKKSWEIFKGSNSIIFNHGQEYEYNIGEHEETNILVYTIHNKMDILPVVESKFRIYFDDAKERRNKTLEEILK